MPDILDLHAEYSSVGEAPENFHRWAIIGGAMVYVGRRVTLGLQYGLWNAHFICMVAPSGASRKSTALFSMKKLLGLAIEGEENVDGTVPIMVGEPTRAALLGDLGRATEDYGTTPAAIIINDEAGNIFDDPKFVRLLDSLYTGEADYDRTTEHSGRAKLKNQSLSVLTCTTPAWLGNALEQYGFGEGTMGRFVFPFAENRTKKVAWPMQTPERDELQDRIVLALRELRQLEGIMGVEPEPYKKFEQWYNSYEVSDPALKVSGWESRVHTHVLKNAMAIAMLRRQEIHMRMSDLDEAFNLVMDIENNLWKVHQNIQMNGELKEVKIMETAIKASGDKGIRHTPLRMKIGRRLGGKQFDDTLIHLLKSQVIYGKIIETKGRPAKYYRHANYGVWTS